MSSNLPLKLRFKCLGVAGLLAAVTVAGAAVSADPAANAQTPSPATAPTTQTADQAARRSPFGNRMIRLRDIGGFAAPNYTIDPANTDPIGDEEWRVITAFAAENFPNRWKLFETVQKQRGADSALVKSLRDRIAQRYRTLMQVQGRSGDLYDAALLQGQLEDAAWGATVESRRRPKDVALQQKMREKVAALVKNLLQERQDRIDTLRATVKMEQDRLDADKDDVEQMIDRQIDRLSGDAPYDPNLGTNGRFGSGGGQGGGRRFGGGDGPRGDGQSGDGPRRERRGGPATRPD